MQREELVKNNVYFIVAISTRLSKMQSNLCRNLIDENKSLRRKLKDNDYSSRQWRRESSEWVSKRHRSQRELKYL